MTEKETLQMYREISKRESAMLKAIEALGNKIESLETDLSIKDRRIIELEQKLAEVKGGKNEW